MAFFDTLLQTGEASQAQLAQLKKAMTFANVFRVKLFDKTGDLTLLSDHLDGSHLTGTALSPHNPAARSVLQSRTAPTTTLKSTCRSRSTEPPLSRQNGHLGNTR